MDMAGFRRQMPVTRRWTYLDHAAVSPLPAPTRAAMDAMLADFSEQGDVGWSGWAERVEAVRRSAAALIGSTPEELAFVPNTTMGISFVAEGFPFRAGDNVVTLANEFPSNAYPWMHLADRGVETRRVPVDETGVDLGKVSELCDGRTRLIAVSWVGYATGFRIDLDRMAAFAHERGARLFVDAIQGLGLFPIDVSRTPIDYLAADGHKWMLGPEGAGLLYVRRERLDELRPLGLGWHSVVHSHDFSRIELNIRPDAARYEGGTWNMVGILGLGASLDLLASFGLSPDRSPLADTVLAWTDRASAWIGERGGVVLSDRRPAHRSGIVSFQWPGERPEAVRKMLLEAGVVSSCRGGRLRISPHAYCDDDDLARFAGALGNREGT
ncbi:MAG: aminotransferase class V-fold PLP-dependent enzyme [Planctomycetes bacterium]|nr:aminotransferase class V-fold PLP-dependent enzyme [Planctomycetota bacterium]